MISILSVVLIHTTGDALNYFSPYSFTYKFFYLIYSQASFAVPVFIFVSGFVLFYRYYGQKFSLLEEGVSFYKKRIWDIAVPYLLFSFIYFIVDNFNKLSISDSKTIAVNYIKAVLTGSAHTHLYYMLVIIQFTVLFPFFIKLLNTKVFKDRALLWVIVGFLCQIAYVYLNRYYIVNIHNIPNIFHKTGSLFISYLFYYFLGAFFGVHFHRIKAIALGNKGLSILLLLLWAVIGIYYAQICYRGFVLNKWAASSAFDYGWLLLNTLSIGLLMVLAFIFYSFNEQQGGLSRLISQLSKYSFGIYLIHPLILKYYRYIQVGEGNMVGISIFILGEFLVAIVGAWLISIACSKNKWTGTLLGSHLKKRRA